jgi:hypothetical protein
MEVSVKGKLFMGALALVALTDAAREVPSFNHQFHEIFGVADY